MLTIVNCETDQTEINNLNQRIDALTIANNNLKAQISTLTGGGTTTIISGTTTIITGNTTTIVNLQNQLNQLQNTLSGANATATATAITTIRNLQTQLNALSENYATLSGNNAMVTTTLSTLQDDINYLNRHKFVYEYDISHTTNIFAIWSDGETMFLGDVSASQVFAYNTTTISGVKMRIQNRDIDTNLSVTSMYSDGTNIWVRATTLNFIAFTLTGARNQIEDFSLDTDNNNAFGSLWSDGTILWVPDNVDDKIYAYNLQTKERVANQDFNTLSDAENNDPSGIWSDGTIMWVVDNIDDKIYAYNLQTKERVANQDFDFFFNPKSPTFPTGIWSDGRTMWVVENELTIRGYDMVTKLRR